MHRKHSSFLFRKEKTCPLTGWVGSLKAGEGNDLLEYIMSFRFVEEIPSLFPLDLKYSGENRISGCLSTEIPRRSRHFKPFFSSSWLSIHEFSASIGSFEGKVPLVCWHLTAHILDVAPIRQVKDDHSPQCRATSLDML